MKLRKMYFDFESGSPWDPCCQLLDTPQSEHEEGVYVLTEHELKEFVREFLIASGVMWARTDVDSDSLVDCFIEPGPKLFNPAQDEAEHLERIKRELEK